MKDIVLIGAGGHAASCIDVIETHGQFRIVGLVGLEHELHQRFTGYEVIATDQDMPWLAKEYEHAMITVGQIRSARIRINLHQQARDAGFTLPVLVSPHAYVSRHAQIGEGSIIMHGAVVNANARIGCNCIINTRAVVEHDVLVGDHCHVSTGAILNGEVSVGGASFVGSGTMVKQGVSIGARCLVGMGSVLRQTLSDGSVFWTGKQA
ncbi:acetyltransferase [Rhodoferax sp. BAB1]|uniref:acetyltransferase n=1 Tax=Rhodoferax sp. BAB1 TaxID=2741720 RepID=UPI001575DDD6|nr:acetyltransferase [Rhodoferax sp. BAB1]QKO22989.1 acetyltransferase [Rhodoferax sp. BAB1]